MTLKVKRVLFRNTFEKKVKLIHFEPLSHVYLLFTRRCFRYHRLPCVTLVPLSLIRTSEENCKQREPFPLPSKRKNHTSSSSVSSAAFGHRQGAIHPVPFDRIGALASPFPLARVLSQPGRRSRAEEEETANRIASSSESRVEMGVRFLIDERPI